MPAKWSGLFALGLFVATAGDTGAQSPYRYQVQRGLATASDVLLDRGYREQETYSSALRDGEEDVLRLTLRAGNAYAIIAVCDEDCHDLDLYLADEDGSAVDSDVATDAQPVVDVVPDQTGRYDVRVKMYNCDADPCFFAMGVYRLPQAEYNRSGNGGRYAGEVRRALRDAFEDLLADRGYQPTDEEFDGSLLGGEQEAVWLRLRRGESYAILGACEEACTDLDLYLYDEDDHEVESDVAPDAVPMIEVRPRRTGDYRIRVGMYSCRQDACNYGVNVYKR